MSKRNVWSLIVVLMMVLLAGNLLSAVMVWWWRHPELTSMQVLQARWPSYAASAGLVLGALWIATGRKDP